MTFNISNSSQQTFLSPANAPLAHPVPSGEQATSSISAAQGEETLKNTLVQKRCPPSPTVMKMAALLARRKKDPCAPLPPSQSMLARHLLGSHYEEELAGEMQAHNKRYLMKLADGDNTPAHVKKAAQQELRRREQLIPELIDTISTQANARMAQLFSPEIIDAEYQRSKAHIDFYVSNNHFEKGAPSPEIQELMIALDMAIPRLYRFAYPYGRSNILVRKSDESGRTARPHSIDIDASKKKDIFDFSINKILDRLWDELTKKDSDLTVDSEWTQLRDAFCLATVELWGGGATCASYATLLALMAAEICSQEKWKNLGVIKINRIGDPYRNDSLVDHALLEISITDSQTGKEIRLMQDPWGKDSMPMFPEHSVYQDGELCFSLDPANMDFYKKLIEEDQQGVQQWAIEALLNAEGSEAPDVEFQDRLSIATHKLSQLDADKVYSFSDTHDKNNLRWYDHGTVGMAKQDVNLLRRERRPSIEPADSNLLLNLLNLLHGAQL